MPAFDPVRDAVLNSPITPSQPLPSRIHLDLPSATHPESVPSTSSPLARRATHLSVLLNSDPPPATQDSLGTPLFTPTTPRAPPTLSHLLHPDDDQLSGAAPLRRKSFPPAADDSGSSYFGLPGPGSRSSFSFSYPSSAAHPSPNLAFPGAPSNNFSHLPLPPIPRPRSPSSLALPDPHQQPPSRPFQPTLPPPPSARPNSRPSTSGGSKPSISPSSSKTLSETLSPNLLNQTPSPVDMPPPPPPARAPASTPKAKRLPAKPPTPAPASAPQASAKHKQQEQEPQGYECALFGKRSNIPYAPRQRITPPGSVLVPLTPAELEKYKNYPGGIGTQLLKSHNRKKRRREDRDDESETPAKRTSHVGLVVEHYNARPNVGVDQRNESPIIGLKSFNNWVKSVLITRFAHPVLAASPNSGPFPSQGPEGRSFSGRMRDGHGVAGKVLDIGCGKGGDLSKWSKARIKEYVGLDIAAVSIDQARSRYASLRGPKFAAYFAAADCYVQSLSQALPAELLGAAPFDAVSMQFCMHYAFESESKARTMLDNVSRWLRPGGVFLGTVPNASQLLARLDALPKDAQELSFGNNVYKIRFEDRAQRPVFGHRYWFFLKDAVDDVPEYVVHWDHFIKMAAEYGLHAVYTREFHEVFAEHQEHAEFGPLLERMRVVDKDGESQMDEDQWEAANIYIAFAFEKRA